jgi:prepilin-type N-terminal cleavage/methylation domain-containing protein
MRCPVLISKGAVSSRKGFTLAELLLAMLVFAIAITTIIALLARSIETVDEVLVKDEAMRLSGALEEMLEREDFDTVYSWAVNWAANVGTSKEIKVFSFNYRADPNGTPRTQDGSLPPVASRAGTVGEDYIIVPSHRRTVGSFVSKLFQEELAALEGRLFYVRFSLSPNNPEPLAASSDAYPSAVLVFYAEFFPVPNLDFTDVDDLGISPAFSYNLAVRR